MEIGTNMHLQQPSLMTNAVVEYGYATNLYVNTFTNV